MTAKRLTIIAVGVLALAGVGCGSSNGCDEHRPYACQQQKASEEPSSDRQFTGTEEATKLAAHAGRSRTKIEALVAHRATGQEEEGE